MANRRNRGGDDLDETRIYREGWTDGYDQGYDQNGYGGQNGYYDGGSDYYDDGQNGYQDGGYYDNGYYDDYGYEDQNQGRMTMAARAAGKANTEPYGRRKQTQQRPQQRVRQQPCQQPQRQRTRQADYADYDYDSSYQAPRKKRRRKKHHPFRNFVIFLLILAAIVGVAYLLLFRAPEQSWDGVHTRKEGFYNILVCATDLEEARTDTMMILSLDEKNGSLAITSLPRDTIVDNGEYVPKLNGVYGLAGGGEAGAEALLDQIETLLGFRPDGYAVINYQVFKDAVDAMGGVTFDVPMEMTVDDTEGNQMVIPAGEQLLDGTTALGVCRYRYGYLMADIQRQYVQQSFLKAMIKQAMAPGNWAKLPAVYRAVMDNMLTDLDGANLRYLVLHALLAGISDIPQNTLPGEGVDYNGASCYGLYGQSVVDLVNEVMNPYEEELTIDDVYILTVYDGYLVESTWRGTAFDASTYEYD